MSNAQGIAYRRLWMDLVQRKSIIAWLIGFVFIHAAFVFSYFYAPDFLVYITREDTWTELLSVAFYGVAAILFGTAAFGTSNRRQRAWCVFLAAGLFFLAGEEWSWGQRFFDYGVESVEHMSTQHEFNLHNLDALAEGPITIERLLSLGSLGLGLLFPAVLTMSSMVRRLAITAFAFPVPHPVIGVCSALSYWWYATFHPGSQYMVAVEESREFTIALGVFAYAVIWFWDCFRPGRRPIVP